jgi:hypothetical protein
MLNSEIYGCKRRHIKKAFGLDFNCMEGKLLAGQSLCAQLHYDSKVNRIVYKACLFLAKRLRNNLDSVASWKASFVRYPETIAIRIFSYISI